MARYVTVEGSITPTVFLPRGARKVVVVDDELRQLLKIGAVVVVDGSLDDDPDVEPDDQDDDDGSEGEGDEGDADDSENGDDEPPQRNASRAAWADWLDTRTPPVAYPSGTSRDQLIDIWQQVSGGR